MTVTVDATKGWARPASSAECTELLGARVMNHWWPCTEASGDLADVISGLTLTAVLTPLYGQPATGWDGTGVACDAGSGDRFQADTGVGPNPATTSQTWMFVISIETEPTSTRVWGGINHGSTTTTCRLVFVPSGGVNKLRFQVMNMSTDGAADHGVGSYIIFARYDRAVSSAKAYSDLETITGTYDAGVTDGRKGFGSGQSPDDIVCLGIGLWTGATAEALDDADIATIRGLFQSPPSTGTTTGSPADSPATALDATTTLTTTGAVAASTATALDATAVTTAPSPTVSSLRAAIISLVSAIVPTYHSEHALRAYRNEGSGRFDTWATTHPNACFRRFQVRDTGERTSPETDTTDVTSEEVAYRIMVAYPKDNRLGRRAAIDRDRARREDAKAIMTAIGRRGWRNFDGSTAPDACPLGAVTTRIEVGEVEFVVVVATFRFDRRRT